ncbi:MAG: metal ABC transporter ATP-binding protein [Oscillospiraceae bacterium]|jgi:zinc transport system ATP-binding protein|nr:metal ABC transporter ATP-binding protein [Oscillospiraceae bacterium]
MKHNGETACGACCLQTKNLTVERDGLVILRDVNLHVHCGEVTAVIGPNGAGKSTLFEALLGQSRYSGKIEYLDANTNTRRKPRFGYVPQTLSIERLAPISVADFLLASITTRPVFFRSAKKDAERIRASLKRVNAEDLAERRLGTLSGGEAQRVMLALALTPTPDLLLLDEPVSGMDEAGRGAFYNAINILKETLDVSICIITHDFTFVNRYADNAVLLNRGEVAAQGRAKRVLAGEVFKQVFGMAGIS